MNKTATETELNRAAISSFSVFFHYLNRIALRRRSLSLAACVLVCVSVLELLCSSQRAAVSCRRLVEHYEREMKSSSRLRSRE